MAIISATLTVTTNAARFTGERVADFGGCLHRLPGGRPSAGPNGPAQRPDGHLRRGDDRTARRRPVRVEWLPTAAGANPHRDATKITRLVAEFHNLVLSHADRSRVISDDDRKKLRGREH